MVEFGFPKLNKTSGTSFAGLKRGLVVSKRLMEAHILLIVNLIKVS